MKRFILFTMLFTLIFASQSCEKYIIKPVEVEDVTFSGHIQPIFTSKCANCHNGTGTVHSLNLSAGSAYAALQDYQTADQKSLLDLEVPENSILIDLATDGHSYNNVSADQEAMILKWIEDGAPNN